MDLLVGLLADLLADLPGTVPPDEAGASLDSSRHE
jgi:hypothetical protein